MTSDTEEELRERVVVLENMLHDSADALAALSEKLRREREMNAQLLEHLEESETTIQQCTNENRLLKQRIARSSPTAGKEATEDPTASGESAARSHREQMLHDLRALAEESCDFLVRCDEDHRRLIAQFPDIEFVFREKIDPYKSTDGWHARRSAQRRLSSKSEPPTSDVRSPTPGVSDNSRAAVVDFPFGSPSKRFLFNSSEEGNNSSGHGFDESMEDSPDEASV